MIQTGTGVIFSIQRKVENIDDSVLNEFLSETNALKNNSREIILVKDSKSGFADALTPPFPKRSRAIGSQTATGMGGSNSGSGGGSSNPGSGGGDRYRYICLAGKFD